MWCVWCVCECVHAYMQIFEARPLSVARDGLRCEVLLPRLLKSVSTGGASVYHHPAYSHLQWDIHVVLTGTVLTSEQNGLKEIGKGVEGSLQIEQ